MDKRIEKLTELTKAGEMYVYSVPTEYAKEDYLLPQSQREVKRLCEFIANQQPKITEYSCFTGFFRFDSTVVGDAFTRIGHARFQEAFSKLYLKPIDGITCMEWQHATADYSRVLKIGMSGTVDVIRESLKSHTKPEEVALLTGLEKVANAVIAWAEKCSGLVAEFAKTVEDAEHKANLEKLADALTRVPRNAPKSFYEAVLTIYICYSLDPDSVGTLDRFLSPFYFADLDSGVLTREQAGVYLQELFLMLQAKTEASSPNFTRGGESHFCIGGYGADGKDCFNDLSKLILESMIELPIWCPQLTLRWTKQLGRENFRFVMDCERKDANKRIAFTNDERRIKAYTELCGMPYDKAINYTTVGCNEPAFMGAVSDGTSNANILYCMDKLFHEKSELILNAKTYEEFYEIFENELLDSMKIIYDFDDKFNEVRSRDVNYVTCLVFNDCIENARSITQGGANYAIDSPSMMGMTNLIDSVIVVKQFVYEDKVFTMQQLVDAVQANWEGYEDMRILIHNKAKFFGNDDDLSNGVAQSIYKSFYKFCSGRKNIFGHQTLVGDLMGYNPHHAWFGSQTKATPDGRHDGEMLKLCIGQSDGNDRNGLTALLNSIAKMDPTGVACGNTVTNITLDSVLIRNDENFEKTVDMFETFFKEGGIHFQLTYVSHEDLVAAKAAPQNYKNLRVRVTGFSDYFVRLNEGIQDDIIRRTVHCK